MLKIKTLRHFLVFLAASTVLNATLIEKGLYGDGDGLITRDTVTGLEWLDLSQSVNLSYNAVQSQLGSEGAYSGFRYASTAEVAQLFSSAGLVRGIYHAPDPQQTANMLNLAQLLGITYVFSDTDIFRLISAGLYDDSDVSPGDAVGLGYLEYRIEHWNNEQRLNVIDHGGNWVGPNVTPGPFVTGIVAGSFLVRQAPAAAVPDSSEYLSLLALTFTALLGLRRLVRSSD